MSKSSNVILITAYTPTVEKTDNLRELIKTLKSLGHEVCLATHSPTPQDIVDRCDYYIYDNKNELNYDPDIAYWIEHITPTFKISYKQYGSMSTHIVPIFRLVIGAFAYLKALSIKKVCMIEYDTIVKNNYVFECLFKQLDTQPVASLYSTKLQNKDKYLTGMYALDLQQVDLSGVPTESTTLLTLYREYFSKRILPVTEKILYDTLWSKYPIAWNDISIADKSVVFQTSEGTNGYGDRSYLFHVHNETLHFFCSNNTNDDWKFDIVINNINHVNTVAANTWRWIPLQDFSGIENIKLIKNNVFIKEFVMSIKEDFDLITKWVIFEQL